MKDLDIRRDWWKTHHFECEQAETPTDLLAQHISIFRNMSVLEIGPGEGRQKRLVDTITSRYSIADISPDVIERYKHIDSFLISDYTEDFQKKFDIVHFWYVIHHVLAEEVERFIDLVNRHVKKDGLIMFNHPVKAVPGQPDRFENNGLKTTLHQIYVSPPFISRLHERDNVSVLVRAPLKIEFYEM